MEMGLEYENSVEIWDLGCYYVRVSCGFRILKVYLVREM